MIFLPDSVVQSDADEAGHDGLKEVEQEGKVVKVAYPDAAGGGLTDMLHI
jgi:hypothetical protein